MVRNGALRRDLMRILAIGLREVEPTLCRLSDLGSGDNPPSPFEMQPGWVGTALRAVRGRLGEASLPEWSVLEGSE